MSTPTRICKTCGVEHPATGEFFPLMPRGLHGVRPHCLPCYRARVRESLKRPEVKAKRDAYHRAEVASGAAAARSTKWSAGNPEKVAATRAKRAEKSREYNSRWQRENPEKAREKARRHYHKSMQDPARRLRGRLRSRLREVLKMGKRGAASVKVFGYTWAELKAHIESRFTEGMTWEALMRGDIHVDHIRPVSSFDIQSVEDPDFKACWGLANLQPLWAADNLRKGAKQS